MAAAAGVEGEGPQGEEAEVKSGGGSKKLLLIGLPVLLLSGGAGAYFAGLLPIGAPEVLMAEMETDPSPDFAPTSIEPLDPFIANLSDENAGGTSRRPSSWSSPVQSPLRGSTRGCLRSAITSSARR